MSARTTALRLADAAVLGACSGVRSFSGVGALAARGRLGGPRGRAPIMAAAAGELVVDKLPFATDRIEPPALAGRVAGGTVAGHRAAGPPGATVAALTAVAAAGAAHRARGALAARLPVPDPVVGVAEDIVTLALAAVASRPHPGARPAPRPALGPSAAPERPLPVRLAGGVAAAATGTAAMTLAQMIYQAATGTGPSRAPEKVGRRLLRATLGTRVPRRRRPALNQAMHWLYGASWGVPIALAGPRARRAPLTTGAAVGLGAWGASLVELPLLGVAPPVWRQEPEAIANDAAFHVIYGVASAAALGVLAR